MNNVSAERWEAGEMQCSEVVRKHSCMFMAEEDILARERENASCFLHSPSQLRSKALQKMRDVKAQHRQNSLSSLKFLSSNSTEQLLFVTL